MESSGTEVAGSVMTELGYRRPRVSSRQAIVVEFVQPVASWMEPFTIPNLQDLLGVLVGVNGTSIFVLSSSRDWRRQIARALPAGVELCTPLTGRGGVAWIVDQLRLKGFEKCLIVASDVIGLPVRVVSTVLTALDSSSVVAGRTPGGSLYLLGLNLDGGSETSAMDAVESIDDSRVQQSLTLTRGLERFTRLRELESVDQLRRTAAGDSRRSPRMQFAINEGQSLAIDSRADDAGPVH